MTSLEKEVEMRNKVIAELRENETRSESVQVVSAVVAAGAGALNDVIPTEKSS